MAVKFEDFSLEVKAAINDISIAWLYENAEEIKSQAQRNTSQEGWTSSERAQLRGSYNTNVNEQAGKAQIGSPLEQAYWEEWGTGEHAAHGDGRKDWWIYIPGSSGGGSGESNHYKTREDAEAMAAYIREKYKKPAIVTNGRDPNYTLEKAFTKVKPGAIEDLKQRLKELNK